ncbi:hypothetical protein K8I31_08185 [bacterium]|nr:hypothetical protein [bacterium]
MKLIIAKSLFMYGLILIACAVVLNAAATPTEDNPFDFIDASLGEDGVISLTGANASKVHPAVINSGFDKYTNVIAPNGSPIHILGQSQVSNAQMARARRILEFYLTSNGNKYGLTGTGADGTIKAEIANTMADRNATLVYTNQAGGIEDSPNIDAFFELNLSLQDLGGNESPVPGSSDWLTNDVRDASYEEIFHLVHGKGIAHVDRALNGWHNPVNAAADKAWGGNSDAGIWHIDDEMYAELFAEENSTHPSDPDEEGAPGGSVPLEYIISCIDVYYGLWEHTGPNGVSFFGEYDPNSRARLLAEDPDGYALVEQFLPPKLEYRETIDSSFNGTFSLTLDPSQAYTYKSQYYQHVSLSGSNNSGLTGNGFDNRLQGNAGNNILRGEAGNDVAIFKGAQSQYVLTQNSDGSVTVIDSQAGRDGSDTLIGFESIEFSDGTAALPLETTATPTPVSVATETPLPASTATPVPPMPTATNTPTPTEIPNKPGDENEPIAYYEFDQVDLSGNGWAEIPGGFGGAPSGEVAFLSDLEGQVDSSDDQLGMKITVDAGEVTFLFAQEAIEVDAPVLMRATLRTSGPVSLALIGLKGDLSTGASVDGSLALNYPLATTSFVEEEGALTMVYQPDQGGVFTPAIQVTASGDAVSVMIDRFEAYALDDEFIYDSVLFERQ